MLLESVHKLIWRERISPILRYSNKPYNPFLGQRTTYDDAF